MSEPTEKDIVDLILDQLKANLTADLQTAIAVGDVARVKSVTIGPIAADKEQYSPYIELYHASQDLGLQQYKGGSFPILHTIGGGGMWAHHFMIQVSQFMVSGSTARATAANRHASLRYRVKKCLRDDPNLQGAEDTFGATVATNDPNDIIIYCSSNTRGGDSEWIWTTTYYVRYRVDQP